jgi:nucleotide-binding universal stress UspA family protein
MRSKGERKAPMMATPTSNHDRSSAASRPFHRVLVAWDGSPDSVAALKMAAAVTGAEHDQVVAYAVLPAPPHVEAWRDDADELPGPARQVFEAFETTRDAIAATRPVQITLHTCEDRRIAESICGYASEHAFDLLVIGRHGNGGVVHPKLGHIAQVAARESKVPVLLVGGR